MTIKTYLIGAIFTCSLFQIEAAIVEGVNDNKTGNLVQLSPSDAAAVKSNKDPIVSFLANDSSSRYTWQAVKAALPQIESQLSGGKVIKMEDAVNIIKNTPLTSGVITSKTFSNRKKRYKTQSQSYANQMQGVNNDIEKIVEILAKNKKIDLKKSWQIWK